MLHRYLGVHDFYPTDRTDTGDLRVILHQDVNSAAVWAFVDRGGESVLEVTDNRTSFGGASVGRYLALSNSPGRGSQSFYVAVTSDINQALVVNAVAEAPSNAV